MSIKKAKINTVFSNFKTTIFFLSQEHVMVVIATNSVRYCRIQLHSLIFILIHN